jgi:hypothetical protein
MSMKTDNRNMGIYLYTTRRTLIISMGWMTHVASIPDAPPLTKGFTVGHTPPALGFFASPILLVDSKSESWELKARERAGERNMVFHRMRY